MHLFLVYDLVPSNILLNIAKLLTSLMKMDSFCLPLCHSFSVLPLQIVLDAWNSELNCN